MATGDITDIYVFLIFNKSFFGLETQKFFSECWAIKMYYYLRGCGDDSVSNMLALQAQRPEFKP